MNVSFILVNGGKATSRELKAIATFTEHPAQPIREIAPELRQSANRASAQLIQGLFQKKSCY